MIDLDVATELLQSGDPLPIDLIYSLVDQGIDVEALEAEHAL